MLAELGSALVCTLLYPLPATSRITVGVVDHLAASADVLVPKTLGRNLGVTPATVHVTIATGTVIFIIAFFADETRTGSALGKMTLATIDGLGATSSRALLPYIYVAANDTAVWLRIAIWPLIFAALTSQRASKTQVGVVARIANKI